MSLFYMHLRRSDAVLLDEEGYERPGLEAMRAEAVWGARDIMMEAIRRGERPDLGAAFEVTSETGQVLLTVTFEEALDGRIYPRPRYDDQAG
jgi:hypothetical protein